MFFGFGRCLLIFAGPGSSNIEFGVCDLRPEDSQMLGLSIRATVEVAVHPRATGILLLAAARLKAVAELGGRSGDEAGIRESGCQSAG